MKQAADERKARESASPRIRTGGRGASSFCGATSSKVIN